MTERFTCPTGRVRNRVATSSEGTLLGTYCASRSLPVDSTRPLVSPFAGRLTFLVSTRKVSKRNDPGGAGWRYAPTTLLCSNPAGPFELARCAGSNRQRAFFRLLLRASAAPTGTYPDTVSARSGSRVAGRASQDLLDQAGVAGRRQGCRASIVRPGMACRWTPDKFEKRRAPAQRAGRPGALSLGYFSLRKQREVTRPTRAKPMTEVFHANKRRENVSA